MSSRPLVTLLTDFGAHDPFVGIMRGVILSLCRDASLIDLCHEVPAHDVRSASFLLHTAVPAFPVGTIHVAVVDPGVGGARRPLVAEIGDQLFVAPDNGLLSYPLASAGRGRIRHLTAQQYWRHPVSASFHGRDIFAPVAGHLACGVDPARLGPEIEDPVRLEIPRPRADGEGRLVGTVVWVDRFGNCITDVAQRDVESFARGRGGSIRVWAGGREVGALVGHFETVRPGETGAMIGSAGYVELFCNQGDLARRWNLRRGDEVLLERSA